MNCVCNSVHKSPLQAEILISVVQAGLGISGDLKPPVVERDFTGGCVESEVPGEHS